MKFKLPNTLLKDLKEVTVVPEEIFAPEILITVDTKPLQIVMNNLLTVVVKEFLTDNILDIKSGFKNIDGTYTLFNYTYEKLNKIVNYEVSDEMSPEQLPIYSMSKKLVMGILSYFIEMHQQDE
jgi:hypothetical protein